MSLFLYTIRFLWYSVLLFRATTKHKAHCKMKTRSSYFDHRGESGHKNTLVQRERGYQELFTNCVLYLDKSKGFITHGFTLWFGKGL